MCLLTPIRAICGNIMVIASYCTNNGSVRQWCLQNKSGDTHCHVTARRENVYTDHSCHVCYANTALFQWKNLSLHLLISALFWFSRSDTESALLWHISFSTFVSARLLFKHIIQNFQNSIIMLTHINFANSLAVFLPVFTLDL